MLIRSKLDYACMIYNTAKPSLLKSINIIQTTALRLATGAFRTSPILSLQNITCEQPLQIRREQFTLKYIYSLSCVSTHPNFSYIFKYTENTIQIKNFTKFQNAILKSINSYNLTPPTKIQNKPIYNIPPWIICEPKCKLEMSHYVKAETSNTAYLQHFRKLQEEHKHHIAIYTDASKCNDQIGAAFVVNEETFKFKLPATTSVFSAELFAIYKSLELVKNRKITNQNFTIYSDSLSSLQDIRNIYPNKYNIQQIQEKIHSLKTENNVNITFIWIPSHVGIPGNETADIAAKEATTSPTHEQIPTQLGDEIANIKNKIKNKQKEDWNTNSNNKLRQIKKDISLWRTSGTRNLQKALTRLRIGHTRLTHSHLFRKEPPDICQHCNTTLTVQHIIIECQMYNNYRQQHKIPNSIQEALANNPETIKNLFKYLADTNLIELI